MIMERQPNLRLATEKPDHIMVSISGDAKTSMTVTWRASLDVKEGYVEYCEKGGEKKSYPLQIMFIHENSL